MTRRVNHGDALMESLSDEEKDLLMLGVGYLFGDAPMDDPVENEVMDEGTLACWHALLMAYGRERAAESLLTLQIPVWLFLIKEPKFRDSMVLALFRSWDRLLDLSSEELLAV